MARDNNVTGWVGWVYFAGVMMMIAGVFQGIVGLTALLNNDFFVVTQEHLAVFNYTTWGWLHLALSVVLLSAGMSVINGGAWGRFVGVILAAMGLIGNFVFIGAYPFWGFLLVAINALVLYALLVHGGEAQEA